MALMWLLTFSLGVLAVLQGGMNRILAAPHGLVLITFVNAVVFLTAAGIYFWLQRPPSITVLSLPLWSVLPGLMGFGFVLGVPLAISRLGALPVFVTLIGAQLVSSLLWDLWIESAEIPPVRIVAATLSFSGAILLWWKG